MCRRGAMCMSRLRQFAAAGVGGFMLGSDSGVIASALTQMKVTGGDGIEKSDQGPCG